MHESETTKQNAGSVDLCALVEKAAEECVFLDAKDLQAMAFFSKSLKEIGAAFLAAGHGGSWCAGKLNDVAKAAAKMVELIIFEESKTADADMVVVGKAVAALQAVCRGTDLNRAGVPAELHIDLSDVSSSKTDNTQPAAAVESATEPAQGATLVSNVVDDAIFEAFIDQQMSILPELEEQILTFEKTSDPQHMAALRRILHTIKGDAGVVGAVDLSAFCHKTEDYLASKGASVSADILMEAKDWIEKAVSSYSKNEKPSNPDQLFAKMTAEEVKPVVTAPPAAPVEHKDASMKPIEIGDVDLAKDFVKEANEHFESADENLLILEHEPMNTEAIGAVFRAFHTIKGVSGFLGLPPIGNLAHKAETLLDDVRRGKRQFVGSVVDVTFDALDLLKGLVADLGVAVAAGKPFLARAALPGMLESLTKVLAGEEIGEKDEGGKAKLETGSGKQEVGKAKLETGNWKLEIEKQEVIGSSGGDQKVEVAKVEAEVEPKESGSRAGVEVAQTMKVDAEKIDLLLDTIGELVIAESIVASDPDIQGLKSLRLEKNLSLLGKITRSLQDMGMAMRLVPIDATFRKMARLVRDLSKKSGKQVELIMEGGETEIDKSMVEKLGDPLVHMIRNSMDHGLESNEERKAKGKDPVGHVTLRAHHKGGSIHIDIEDDGKGLDREAIVAKAIEKGLLKTGDGVPDQEVFALIFAAGFSTAKQITEISGRGVGMDVVRRNIESLRGSVLINTRPGQGTVFTIVLPLTMAIIDGMLTRVSSEIYVLPTLSIIESFRPSADMISGVTGKAIMVSFRGSLLPLFKLSNIFGVSGAIENPTEAIVMVVDEGGKRWGLLVDEILGQQQIVIKSLGAAMGNVPGVSGASIMADGRPGLILDIGGVIKLATE